MVDYTGEIFVDTALSIKEASDKLCRTLQGQEDVLGFHTQRCGLYVSRNRDPEAKPGTDSWLTFPLMVAFHPVDKSAPPEDYIQELTGIILIMRDWNWRPTAYCDFEDELPPGYD